MPLLPWLGGHPKAAIIGTLATTTTTLQAYVEQESWGLTEMRWGLTLSLASFPSASSEPGPLSSTEDSLRREARQHCILPQPWSQGPKPRSPAMSSREPYTTSSEVLTPWGVHETRAISSTGGIFLPPGLSEPILLGLSYFSTTCKFRKSKITPYLFPSGFWENAKGHDLLPL